MTGVFFFLAGSLAEAEPAKKEAPRVEGELLIWSGGKTRAEAERQQQALKAYQKALEPVLPLTSEVLESARVPGLKPGFFIVALGVCPKEKVADPLGVLKAVSPEVYTRSVKYPPDEATPALGCPELESVDGAGEPVRWSLHRAERLEQGGNTFIGLAFTYRWSEQGDFARDYFSSKVLYLLVGKKQRLVDSKVHDGPSDATTLESFSAEGNRLVSQLDYGDPPCNPSDDVFKGWRTRVKASVVKGHIEVSVDKPTLVKEGSCGYAQEERMVTGQDAQDAAQQRDSEDSQQEE